MTNPPTRSLDHSWRGRDKSSLPRQSAGLIARIAMRRDKAAHAPVDGNVERVTHLMLEVEQTNWLDLTLQLTPRSPYIPPSGVEYALTYLPFAVAIALGGLLRDRFGAPAAVLILGLLMMAALSRPAYYAMRRRRPAIRARLRSVWAANVHRSLGRTFASDDPLRRLLGKANARRFQIALSEAIYCAKMYHQRRLSGLTDGVARQRVSQFLERYRWELATVVLPQAEALSGEIGSKFAFNTVARTVDNGSSELPEALAVSVEVIPDINLPPHPADALET